MITFGAMLVALALTGLSYKIGYDHSEVKYSESPPSVDDILERREEQ